MKNGLQRKVTFVDDNYQVNVWNVTTKTIAFTGNISDAARFLGIGDWPAKRIIQRKTVYKKKYTLRIKSSK